MKKRLNISQILVYYDLPELFVATDEVYTNYLCLLVEVDNGTPIYFGTAISKNRLTKFVSGHTDLRDIFVSPEIAVWYTFTIVDSVIEAEEYSSNQLPDKFLPDNGFYLNEQTASDIDSIINEVIENNNTIVHLGFSDDEDNKSIPALDMGEMVTLYQLILENSYKKVIAERKDRKNLLLERNYRLRAFASSPGSFNLHFYSESQSDLFGTTWIEFALEKFDQISNSYSNNDDLINALRSVKGHAISSYKKLIQKIISSNIKVKHKWASPSNPNNIHYSVIDKPKAEKIFNVLNLSDELSQELKEFSGFFVQVDVERGTWRIYNSDDAKEYNGEAKPSQLEGVTVRTVNYTLVCEEIIEEFKITEKEKSRYVLKTIFQLD